MTAAATWIPEMELTSTADANGSVVYVHVETDVEMYLRVSNERADAAMEAGLHGNYELAEERAELADVYGSAIGVLQSIKRIQDQIRWTQ